MTKKTNAEVQAKYRNSRVSAAENGEQRLNTWISTEAKMALKRISRHSSESQKQVLERLIIDMDKSVVEGMTDDEWNLYFGFSLLRNI